MDDRPFHNIWMSFRGPSARQETRTGSDPQLEDNATKALINLLDLAPDREELTASFLEQVARIPLADGTANPEFFLQGGPDVVDAPSRYLLGLSVSGEPAAAVDGVADGRGRADAAIYLRGRVLCALEVKVGDGELDHAQLVRHAQRWGVVDHANWRTSSWADVYRWAVSVRGGRDPVSLFLLDQLLGFLRAAELTPFIGFFDADFAFFEGPAAERDWRVRQRLRMRMASVWEAIAELLDDTLVARIGETRVQSIKPYESAAVVSTPANPRGVNLTIELWRDEVQLNLVGWNDRQVSTLIKWLRTDQAERWLHDHPAFEVVVFRRFPTSYTAAGRPVWRSQSEEELPGHLAAGAYRREQLDARLAQLPAGDHPGIHLRIAWPRARAIALRESLANALAAELRVLEPLLEEINADPAARVSW